MDILFALGLAFRGIIVCIGFVAMWALWDARAKRQQIWTQKMRDIWWCHMGFVFAAVSGNMELLYRGVAPTASSFLIAVVLVWSVKGALCGEMYTKREKQ